MLQQYNSYELNALKQISEYRNIFSADVNAIKNKKATPKYTDTELIKKIEKFTDLFCENNFADADYSIIQNGQSSFASVDAWIDNMNIQLILQCITYIIWTDKSNKGYFVKKINDNFLIQILGRLNTIIEEYDAGKLLSNASQEVVNMNTGTTAVKKNGFGKGFLTFFW